MTNAQTQPSKLHLRKFFYFLFLLIAGVSFAQPADEDFTGASPTTPGTSVTIDDLVFTANVSVGFNVANSAVGDTPLDDGDDAFFVNATSTNASFTELIITNGALPGGEFELVSFEIGETTGGATSITVTGYRDGGSVATDNIDLTTTDATGDIHYTVISSNSGTVTPQTSDPDWRNIDEIRITAGGAMILALDNFDFSVAVPANSAPTLTGSISLTGINEDAGDDDGSGADGDDDATNNTNNAGTLVSAMVTSFSTNYTDADGLGTTGFAVTAVDNSNGTWQYTTDGSSYSDFGTPSATTARLLANDADNRIRFVPNGNYNGGSGNITLVAWDQETGIDGNTADVSGANAGGSTAFSTGTGTASLTVSAVNDAPTLTGTATLTGIDEDSGDDDGSGADGDDDATNNTNNAGTLVSAIVTSFSTNYTDAEGTGTAGFAVTAVDNSNGTWQYTTDGSSYSDFGTPSATTARLLANDANNRIRFVPNGNYNGGSGNITLVAWDQSTGVDGNTADVSGANAGGTTAFSTGSGTASLTVSAVNDAPTLTGTATLTSIDQDSGDDDGSGADGDDDATNNTNNPGTLVSAIVTSFSTNYTDTEGLGTTGFAVTAVDNSNGTWQYTTDGSSYSDFGTPTATTARLLANDANNRIRFVPNGGYTGSSGSITLVAWDQSTGTDGNTADVSGANAGGTTAFSTGTGTASLTVSAVNNAPTLTGSITLTGINEDSGDDDGSGADGDDDATNNTNNAGTLVSAMVTSFSTDYADADGLGTTGFAVTAVDNSNGTWQYTTDGSSYSDFGTPSATTARLLANDADNRIRFVPNGNYNGGSGNITLVAWDQETGIDGNTADVSGANAGGSTAFSTGTGTASLTVSAVNDAPTLTGTTTLTGIDEDSGDDDGSGADGDDDATNNTNNAGTLVSAIVTSFSTNYTDAEGTGTAGFAVTAVDNSNGTWQYTTDGSSYSDFGTPSATTARLLANDANNRIRFVPNGNYNGGSGNITLVAWDQSTGVDGNTADVSGANAGGTTAFSTGSGTASLTVSAVNDAPTLTGSVTLTGINEDAGDDDGSGADGDDDATNNSNNPGTLVSAIVTSFSTNYTDTEGLGTTGFAVTAVDNSNGTWQYTTDGSNYSDFGTPTATTARLLANDANNRIRFVPNGNYNGGSGNITLVAWDQSTGTDGNTADVSGANAGGTTAFSTGTGTASLTVSAVNDAPTLTGSTTLTGINEDSGDDDGSGADGDDDATNNTNNAGTLVSAIVTSFSTNYTDAEGTGTAGFAVTAVDNSNGTWQYTTDGSSYSDFGTPSATTARLLANDGNNRIRFVPNGNYNGGSGNITLVAWDQSTGVDGNTADVSGANAGGSTAFSTGSGTASLTVSAVNDAPTLTGSITLTGINEDAGDDDGSGADGDDDATNNSNNPGTLVSAMVTSFSTNFGDIDAGASTGFAVTTVDNSNGTWQYTTDGSSYSDFGTPSATTARLLANDGNNRIRFVPNGNYNGGSGNITLVAWDQSTGVDGNTADVSGANAGGTTAFSTATGTASLTVTALNDAPTLTGSVSLTGIDEDSGDDDGSGADGDDDATSNSNNPGTSVSAIIASFSTNYADAEGLGTTGFAVTAVDNTNGTWQYTTDGTNYSDFGTPSATTARLLANDADNRIRFVPNTDYNGTSGNITLVAWDQTTGTDGNTANVSGANAGGTTAFSTGTGSASLTVAAVNDRPTIAAVSTTSTTQNSGVSVNIENFILTSDLSVGPSNESSQSIQSGPFTVTVTGETGDIVNGNGALTFNGTHWDLSFNTNSNTSGTATLNVTVADDGGTPNGGDDTSDATTVSLTVNDTNAPAPQTLTPSNGATLVTVASTITSDTTVFTAVFDENISIGTGNILLKEGSTTLETVDVTNATKVSVSGATLTLKFDSFLEKGTSKSYSIEIPTTAITDGTNQISTFTWAWSMEDDNASSDNANIAATFPANGATGISPGITQLLFIFDEPVAPQNNDNGRDVLISSATDANYTSAKVYQTDFDSGQSRDAAFSLQNHDGSTQVNSENAGTIWALNFIGTTAGGVALQPSTTYTVELEEASFEDQGNTSTGNDFREGAGSYTFTFTTSSDGTAPAFVGASSNPVANAGSVDVNSGDITALTMVLEENENSVSKGTGNIFLYIDRSGSEELIETIDVTSGDVSIGAPTGSNYPVTITLNNKLSGGLTYYVLADAGTFVDQANNQFAGLPNNMSWRFTTNTETVTPANNPTEITASRSPQDNATNVAIGSNFTMVFDEPVRANTTGTISLSLSANNTVVESLDMSVGADVSRLSFSGDSLTIDWSSDLAEFTGYFVTIDGSAIEDFSDNAFAGITTSSLWNFVSASGNDGTGPVLLSTNPANGAMNVDSNSDIVLTFSEAVTGGAGNITIDYTNDATFVDDVIAGNNGSLVISNNLVTIPNSLLTLDRHFGDTDVDITLAASAFADGSGNNNLTLGTGNFTFQIEADDQAPVITPTSPADDASLVTISTLGTLTFTTDETVTKATGDISILLASDLSTVGTIPNSNISVSGGTTVNINTTGITFLPQREYLVSVPAGLVVDGATPTPNGNAIFGGTGGSWSFTTENDGTPPTVDIVRNAVTSGSLATGTADNTVSFTCTFSEAINPNTFGLDDIRVSFTDILVGGNATDSLQANSYSGITLTGAADSTVWTVEISSITLPTMPAPTSNGTIFIDINGAINDTNGNPYSASGQTFDGDGTVDPMIIDRIAPSLVAGTGLTIASDLGPAFTGALVGTNITLTMQFSEDLSATPTVVFRSGNALTNDNPVYFTDVATSQFRARYEVLNVDNTGTVSYTVDVSDLAGNTAQFTQVNNTNSSEVNVDAEVPELVSITRNALPTNTGSFTSTNADSVSYTIVFTERVGNFDANDDIVLRSTGLSGITRELTTADNITWTLAFETVAGDGSLDFDLINNGSSSAIVDGVGNTIPDDLANGAVVGTSDAFTFDNSAPGLTSFSKNTPSQGSTDTTTVSTVSYSIQFNQIIDADTFDLEDIEIDISGGATVGSGTINNTDALASVINNQSGNAGTITLVNSGDNTNFTVTVNNVAGDGRLGISLLGDTTLVAGAGIVDAADNALGGGNGSTQVGPTFVIDNTPPTVAITRQTPAGLGTDSTNVGTIVYQLRFPEDIDLNTVDNADFTVVSTGSAAFTGINFTAGGVAVGDTVVTISGVSGTGSLEVEMPGTGVFDNGGNALTANTGATPFGIDNTSPGVALGINTPASGTNAFTNASTVVFTVAFDQVIDNSTFGLDDIRIDLASGATVGGVNASNTASSINTTTPGSVVLSTNVDNRNYTITVNNIAGNGTLGVTLLGAGIQDVANNFLGGGSGVNQSSSTITIDNIQPTVIVTDNHQDPDDNTDDTVNDPDVVTITATFTEANGLVTTPQISISGAGVTNANMSGSGLVWTYDWMVPSGTIANAVVTISNATDEASNTIGTQTNTNAGDYEVDNTNPTVAITRQSPVLSGSDSTNSSTIVYQLRFVDDIDLSTVDNADFSTTLTGSVSFTGINFTAGGVAVGDTIVTVSGVSGTGTLRVDMPGTGVSDIAGNTLTANTGATPFGIDNTSPGVALGINTPASGTNAFTNASTVVFTVAFDQVIDNSTFDLDDIRIDLASGATVGGVNTSNTASSINTTTPGSVVLSTNVDDRNYTITVNNIAGNGTLGVTLLGAGIQDLANNFLGGGSGVNQSSSTITIDNIQPTVIVTDNHQDPDDNTDDTVNDPDVVTITATFTEANGLVTTPQISISGAGVTNANMSGSGLVWTYDWMVPSGTIANAVVTISNATDEASNTIGTQTNTNAGDYEVDNTSPTVAITRQSPVLSGSDSTNSSTIVYQLRFVDDIDLSTVDNADFATTLVGSVSFTGINFTAGGVAVGDTIVTVSGVSGTGTLRVDMPGTGVTDIAGNTLTANTGATPFGIDNTSPGVALGINTPASGTNAFTNASTVVFTVAFDQVIDNSTFDLDDIRIDLASGATVGGVNTSNTASSINTTTPGSVVLSTNVDDRNYTITVNNIAGNGTLGVTLLGAGIQDLANNFLGGGSGVNQSSSTITIDNIQPTVIVTDNHQDPDDNTDDTVNDPDVVTITATFTEVNGLVTTPQISISGAGVTNANMSGSGLVWTYDWMVPSGTIANAVVTISNATDEASNTIGTQTNTNAGDYEVDNTSPTVAITRQSPVLSGSDSTNSSTIVYQLRFVDDIDLSTVDNADFATTLTGSVSFTGINFTAGGVAVGDTIVTVSGVSGTGTLRVDMPGTGVTDIAGNTLTANTGATPFGIDNTVPSVTLGINDPGAGDNTLTSENTVVFTVAFDQVIDNSTFDLDDIRIDLASGATVGGVNTSNTASSINTTTPGSVVLSTNVDDRNYTITVNNIAGNGTLGVTLLGAGIQDLANNFLGGGSGVNQSSSTITIDNIAPTSTITAVTSGGSTTQIFVTFSENVAVNTANPGDFTVTDEDLNGITVNSIADGTAGDAIVTLNVADFGPSGTDAEGDVLVTYANISNNTILDLAGNSAVVTSAATINRTFQGQITYSENSANTANGDTDNDVAMYRTHRESSFNALTDTPITITPSIPNTNDGTSAGSTITIYNDEALTSVVQTYDNVTGDFSPTVAEFMVAEGVPIGGSTGTNGSTGTYSATRNDLNGVYTFYITESAVNSDTSRGPAVTYSIAFLDSIDNSNNRLNFALAESASTDLRIGFNATTGQELRVEGSGMSGVTVASTAANSFGATISPPYATFPGGGTYQTHYASTTFSSAAVSSGNNAIDFELTNTTSNVSATFQDVIVFTITPVVTPFFNSGQKINFTRTETTQDLLVNSAPGGVDVDDPLVTTEDDADADFYDLELYYIQNGSVVTSIGATSGGIRSSAGDLVSDSTIIYSNAPAQTFGLPSGAGTDDWDIRPVAIDNYLDANVTSGRSVIDTLLVAYILADDNATSATNLTVNTTTNIYLFEPVDDIVTQETDFVTEYFTCQGDPISPIVTSNAATSATYIWYADDGDLTFNLNTDTELVRSSTLTNANILGRRTAFRNLDGTTASTGQDSLYNNNSGATNINSGIFYYWVHQVRGATDDFLGTTSSPTLLAITVFTEPTDLAFNGNTAVDPIETDNDIVDYRLFYDASDLTSSVSFTASSSFAGLASFNPLASASDTLEAASTTNQFRWYTSNSDGDRGTQVASGASVTAAQLQLTGLTTDAQRYIYLENVTNIVQASSGQDLYQGCTSNGVVIQFTVKAAPAAPTGTTSFFYCEGETVANLTMNGEAGNTFRWLDANNNLLHTEVADASGVSIGDVTTELGLGTNPATDSIYTIKVLQVSDIISTTTNSTSIAPDSVNLPFAGAFSDTTSITINVRALPAKPVIDTSSAFCDEGDASPLSISFTGDGNADSYTLYQGDSTTQLSQLSSNASVFLFTLDNANLGQDSTVYLSQTSFTSIDGAGEGCESNSTQVNIFPNPIMETFSAGNIFVNEACDDGAVNLSVNVSNKGTLVDSSYQVVWSIDGTSRQTANSPSLILTDSTLSGTVTVDVTVTNNTTTCATTIEQGVLIGTTPQPFVRVDNVTTGANTLFTVTDDILTEAQVRSVDFALKNTAGDTIANSTLEGDDSGNLFEGTITQILSTGLYDALVNTVSESGCVNTDSLRVVIIPQVSVTQDTLIDFDNFDNSWFAFWDLEGGADSTTWEVTTPAGIEIFEDPRQGNSNIVVTNATGSYGENEVSYIYSPSFDISGLALPAVSFDYYVDMVNVGDGVSFQWSTDDGNSWETVGDFLIEENQSTGRNWYTNNEVTAQINVPGNNDRVAWATDGDAWQKATHSLTGEEIPNFNTLRFRFALASRNGDKFSGTDIAEGFAFDNFELFSREKISLVETFSSVLSESSNSANISLDSLLTEGDNLSDEIIWINFFTDLLNDDDEEDPLHASRPTGSNARTVFYSVEEVPRAALAGEKVIADGSGRDNLEQLYGITARDIQAESLESPEFTVEINGLNISENQLTVDSRFVARQSAQSLITADDQVSVRIVILQSEIDATLVDLADSRTQPTTYKNVARAILPGAEGSLINVPVTSGEVVFEEPVTWEISGIFGVAGESVELRVVAFIQNEVSKDIYQVATTTIDYTVPETVTSISTPFFDEGESYELYPNPADKQMTIKLHNPVREELNWSLYDQAGKEVYRGMFRSGEQEVEVDTREIRSGLYLLKLFNATSTWESQRVIILRNSR